MTNGIGRPYFVKPAQIILSGDAQAAQAAAIEAKEARDEAQAAQAGAEAAEDGSEAARDQSQASAVASADSAAASADSATASAISAVASANSAAASEGSRLAAEAAEAAAEAALDNFTDIYLGPHATPPTTDNDGGALIVGAMYYDSTNLVMKVYNGTIWTDFTGAATVPATAVTVTPAGNISSTNAQAALQELDTEKASNTSVALKADKTYVDAQDAALQTNINAKAATTYVDSENDAQDVVIATKASTSYVDAQITIVQNDADAAGVVASTALATANAALPKAGGTMTGAITLAADAALALQPVTKQQMDAAHTTLAAATALKVSKTGDTMTGPLTLSGAPSADLHASTKKYVDDANTAQNTTIASKVAKAGDTMTGALTLPGNPANPLEAAPKQYVDTKVAKTADNGAGVMPTGSTAQRPGSPAAGYFRFNSQIGKFEGFDGTVWGAVGGGATIADSLPANPTAGQLWWESDTGALYVYYDDGTSQQWVQVNANTGIPEAPIDNGEYVRVNGVWRLKSQRFSLTNVRYVDVSVPSWAKLARIKMLLQSAVAIVQYPLLQLGLTPGSFDATAGNYALGGGSHAASAASPTLWQPQHSVTTYNGMVLGGGTENTSLPVFIDASILVRRPSDKLFSASAAAQNYSTAGTSHHFFHNYYSAGTSVTQLVAFRIINNIDSSYASDSWLDVEWV